MPEDFYFAYGYEERNHKATRLYRFVGGNFERYDVGDGDWKPDPEQCRIFIGEDWDYEEINEEQANSIINITV